MPCGTKRKTLNRTVTLNDRNTHPRDAELTFQPDTHTYFYRGRPMKSVTTLVNEYFPVFDTQYWATRRAMREGVDPQVIIDRWNAEAERERRLGTEMHERIERHYLDIEAVTCDAPDALRLFHMFASANRLHPYRTEWRIYHEEHDIAGTLDMLERTPDGTFVIYDWKRSRKLLAADGRILAESPFRSRGLYPLTHLPDTSYWHYALQLSIYRYILAERYGIHVSHLRLGVFHPSYSTPWIISLPYLEREVKAILSHRKSNHQ